jgi:hypothetical protein
MKERSDNTTQVENNNHIDEPAPLKLLLVLKIEILHCLETLDIRGTKVEILPIQVIMLQKLAYLFVKFQLSHVYKGNETNKLFEFQKKKSVCTLFLDLLLTIEKVYPSRKESKEG